MNSEEDLRIQKMRERFAEINKVSKTFCLAKWLQATVHLHMGHTHSCHHPTTHKVPLDEIEKDPSALVNTRHNMRVRKQMLQGLKPEGCNFCWNIEKLGKGHLSDRCYKSTDAWAYDNFQKVRDVYEGNSEENFKITPTYLEVSFENTCNFKCVYCTPEASSKWVEEVKKHGPIKQTHHSFYGLDRIKKSCGRGEHNPYVKAFWKWWPDLYPQLHTFRITGGEPLLSRDTWTLFERIKKNPRPEMELAINTNLGVPNALIDRLIGVHNSLAPSLKNFVIYTSFESVGEQAEYARYGMKYDRFIRNIEKILEQTQARVGVMTTVNILSIPTFKPFLQQVFDLRTRYNEKGSNNRVLMSVSHLVYPPALDMRILTPELKQHYVEEYKNFVYSHNERSLPDAAGRIYLKEIDQIERVCNYMMTEPNDLEVQRKNFALFVDQIDSRRSLSFLTTFPELEDFYWQCKQA